MDINKIIDKNNTFAIIGASNNPEKYGFKIYKNLKDKGYKIIPVNNKEIEIQGDKAYKSIDELPEKVDVLNFVVPPQVSLEIVKQAIKLGYKIFWFQPGSSDNTVLQFLEQYSDITTIYDTCIMLQTN